MFSGGLGGAAYRQAFGGLKAELDMLVAEADALPPLPEGLDAYARVLDALYGIVDRVSAVSLFAHCWSSADTVDKRAQQESGQVRTLWDRYERAWVPLNDQLARCDDAAFAALVERPDRAAMRPALEDARRSGALLLPRAEQALLNALGRDGIHAWSRHYDRVSGRLVVTVGDSEPVSVGRAKNLLGSGDAELRAAALAGLDVAWSGAADD
ncbi:MAG: oligoendopeptidase F, partial [Myxococcota bacterium]